MTAQNPAPARHPDPETARLLDEVIGLLAAAWRDEDRRCLTRPRGKAARERTGIDARMRPAAVRLARSAARGDRAGMRRALEEPKTRDDWRRFAVLLASAADPDKLEPAAESPLRRAS